MIKKCLFPVAGYGTRFLPATKSMPKEMMPIVNKPLVQYGVEEAIEAGMSTISFVTGRGKASLVDYFDMAYELERTMDDKGKPLAPLSASRIDVANVRRPLLCPRGGKGDQQEY